MSSTKAIISAFGPIVKDDYTWYFEDFDNDGILNIDDPDIMGPGSGATFEEVRLSDEIKEFIAVRKSYKALMKEIMDKLKKMGGSDAKVKGRVKTPISMINKLRRKRLSAPIKTAKSGEKYTQGLTDIAGTMLIVSDNAQIDKVKGRILNGELGKVFDHEDFYANPLNGYRAHHFIIEKDGLLAEVQLKTSRQSKVSAASHTPYKKGNLNAYEMNRLTELAFRADSGNENAAELIDQILADSDTVEKLLTARSNPEKKVSKTQKQELNRLFDSYWEGEPRPNDRNQVPSEVAARQQQLDELIALYTLAKQKGKIKPEATAAIEQAISNLAEMVDMSFEPSKEAEDIEQPKEKQQKSTTAKRTLEDIRLEDKDPIVMTKGERRKANEAANAILEKNDQEITDDDLEVLRKFTGAGGISETYKAGLLNEHYTSYPLIETIWTKLKMMGVQGGNFLEPGAGIGNFAGFKPPKANMIMVEKSPISSRIAQLLYPQQETIFGNFAQVDLSPYNITGVVGNVPFGKVNITPQRDTWNYLKPTIHNYFFLKSIEAAQPGSPIALITSVNLMDAKDSKIREAILSMAHFVTAFRLPANTFKANASTTVTTDIIILQKYSDGQEPVYDDNFLNTVATEVEKNGEIYPSQHSVFYAENPDHVLGRHEQGYGQQFLGQWGVEGDFDAAAIKTIMDAKVRFPNPLPEEMPVFASDQGVRLPLKREYHSGSIVFYEGKIYEKERVTYNAISIPKAQSKKIQSACELLDDYADFVSALAKNLDDTETKRTRFRRKMDDHIDKYGLPDEDKALKDVLRYDPRLYKLTAFVKRDPDTGNLEYADVFEMKSMYQNAYNPTLSDSNDLGEITMYLLAKGSDLSIEDYETLYKGGTAEPGETLKAISEHPDFFYNAQTEKYEYKYVYLSGNVRAKLDVAKKQELTKNIEALEKMLPKELTVFDFNINPKAIHTWLPVDVVTDFLNHTLGGRAGYIKHAYSDGIGSKTVDVRVSVYYSNRDKQKGLENVEFSKMLKYYIQNSSFPIKYIDNEGQPVSKKRAEDLNTVEKSKELQRINTGKMNSLIEREFMSYLRIEAPDQERAMVEKLYNDYFTNTANPKFDGSTFRVKGMSNTFYGAKDFTVYRHNLMVAEKLAWNGRGGNCHDVGAGKTLASILLSQNLKQRGLAKKQLFVVPGKVIEKWQEEYLMLFPDAKVLNLRLAGQKKDKELVLAQLYDWDAIFIPTHAFSRIPLSPEVRIATAQARIEEFREMLASYGDELDSAEKRTVKQIEKMVEEFEKTIYDLKNSKRETDVYYDELGIDSIFIDEAHFYKNAISTGRAYELGIAGKFSQRAEDMLQKCNYLRTVQGERNIFVLTATPVVNSPIEIYHMLKLCAPSVLDDRGLSNLDDFIDTFIDTDTVFQKSASGQFVQKEIVSGYRNIPEMQLIIDSVMDIKSYDQLQQFYIDYPEYITKKDGTKKLLQPFKRPTSDIHNEMVEPSRIHEILFEDIQHRADDIIEIMKKGKIPVDNFLVITSDGSNLATDLRLYDEAFEGFDNDDSLKIKSLAKKVVAEYNKQGIATGGGSAGPSDELNIAAARKNPAPMDEIYADLRENPFRYADDVYGDYFWKSRATRTNPPPPVFRNQIIFAEAVNRKNKESFHQEIKRHLVQSGIPEQEICIINGKIIGVKKTKTGYADQVVPAGADREEYKQAASDDFNRGRYRIIIGNQTIAEGMNLDRWTTAIHHLDVPYTPAQIQQRNGRGVRQNNRHGHVNVFHYLMKDSFDQYRLQLVIKKQNWIDKLFYGDDRDAKEDISGGALDYEQMMAATASDPRIVEYMEGSHRLKTLSVEIEQAGRNVEITRAAAEKTRRSHDDIKSSLRPKIEAEKLLMEKDIPDFSDISITHTDGFMGADAKITQWRPRVEVKSYRNYVINERPHDNELLLSQKLNKTNLNGGSIVLTLENASTYKHDQGVYMHLFRKSRSSSVYEMMDIDNMDGVEAIERVGQFHVSEKQSVIIGTLEEFFEAKGIKDALSEAKKWLKERGMPTTNFIPWLKEIGANNVANWADIIDPRIKKMFHNAEKTFKDESKGRYEEYIEEIEDAKEEYDTREKARNEAFDLHNKLLAEDNELVKKITDLRGIVNELMQTEFGSRTELYDHLNEAVLPGYGIERELEMRMTGTKERKSLRENGKASAARLNPSLQELGTLAYLGRAIKLETNQFMLEGDDYMFSSADGKTLYLVPAKRVSSAGKVVNDKAAQRMHEQFKHYQADDNDFAISIPGTSPVNWGYAEKIWYKSDKIMQKGDKKGKDNYYVHDFDPLKRKIYKWDDIIIIKNLRIDGRGILN